MGSRSRAAETTWSMQMSEASKDNTETVLSTEQLAAMRKEAGLRIDPQTAEVTWTFAYVPFDPYSDGLLVPEEYKQVGRAYFARSPESDVWVWFGDLPQETQTRLFEASRARETLLDSELSGIPL